MGDDLIVKSKVRDFVSKKNFRIGQDAFNSLSAVVANTVTNAMERAKSNGRKTIKGYDC